MSHVRPQRVAQLVHAHTTDRAIAVEDKPGIQRLLATDADRIADSPVGQWRTHRLAANPELHMATERHVRRLPQSPDARF